MLLCLQFIQCETPGRAIMEFDDVTVDAEDIVLWRVRSTLDACGCLRPVPSENRTSAGLSLASLGSITSRLPCGGGKFTVESARGFGDVNLSPRNDLAGGDWRGAGILDPFGFPPGDCGMDFGLKPCGVGVVVLGGAPELRLKKLFLPFSTRSGRGVLSKSGEELREYGLLCTSLNKIEIRLGAWYIFGKLPWVWIVGCCMCSLMILSMDPLELSPTRGLFLPPRASLGGGVAVFFWIFLGIFNRS